MADYCTLDDIQGWLPASKKIDNQTGAPTSGEVEGWITDFSGDINAAAALGGATVPVTNADWLSRFKIRLARELAYQVEAVRGAFKDELKENLYLGWHQEYLDMIKLLEAGKAIVVLSTESSGAIASSYTMNAPDNPDSSVNPVFKRDQAHNW